MAGKPTEYREEFGEQLIRACQDGYSPTGFAGKLGIARQTLMDWRNRHPAFAEAFDRARSARVDGSSTR